MPDDEIKTNRLSIFLLKEEFTAPQDILKNHKELQKMKFGSGSTLYWRPSRIAQPKWVRNFFNTEVKKEQFLTANSQAVLIVKIRVDKNTTRIFAIPFGSGYHLLAPGATEERFGLRTVLNSVDEKLVRSIDKKNMANIPIHAREQISINSPVASFGINIEQDLILGVTGRSKDENLGKTITGRDALNVAVKVNIDGIAALLLHTYLVYQKKDYVENFGWIDQIAELRDKGLIGQLDSALLDQIHTKNLNKLWMALPEVIDWEDVDGFRYSYDKKSDLMDDIFLDAFLLGFPSAKDISLELLKKTSVLCYSKSGNSTIHIWKAYQCLYCEIEHQNETFLLTNGKWYRIEASFLQSVNAEYAAILSRQPPSMLPDYAHRNEEDYNQDTAAKQPAFALMDRKLVKFGGGYSKIEFCDLFSEKKEMIHVKYYGGSSVLSHLFNQGLVSGETTAAASDFRKNVNAKLPTSHQLPTPFTPRGFSVVYAIISASKKNLDLPFFSKVSLKNAKRILEAFGYSVFLTKVQATSKKRKKR